VTLVNGLPRLQWFVIWGKICKLRQMVSSKQFTTFSQWETCVLRNIIVFLFRLLLKPNNTSKQNIYFLLMVITDIIICTILNGHRIICKLTMFTVCMYYGGWFVPCRISVFSGRKREKAPRENPPNVDFFSVFAWRPFAPPHESTRHSMRCVSGYCLSYLCMAGLKVAMRKPIKITIWRVFAWRP